MFVILGATGHVGGAAVDQLLEDGVPVLGIAHDDKGAAALRDKSAEAMVVDVADAQALRAALKRGSRAFLLNPPGDVSRDVDAEETHTIRAIAEALEGSGLEKIVVESTYGAQPGEALGDLSILCEFEKLIAAADIPAAINRGAFYYTNLDAMLPAAREGKLPSMYPPDLVIPMVAPADLGRAAARRLVSGLDDAGVRYVEGPERHSFADVAAAFARALGRPVEVEQIQRDQWEETYRAQNFSAASARSFARMTAVSVDGGFEIPDDPERGTVTIDDYIADLVRGAA